MADFTIRDVLNPKKDHRILAPKPLRNLMLRFADQRLHEELALMAMEEKLSEGRELTDLERQTIQRFKKMAHKFTYRAFQDIASIVFKTQE